MISYLTVGTWVSIIFYIFVILSPFIKSIRNLLIKIDDEYNIGINIYRNIHMYINGGIYIRISEIVIQYIIYNMFLGSLICTIIIFTWGFLLPLILISITIRIWLIKLRNKNK